MTAAQTIAVVGAGAMGAGIAQVAAVAGHPVRLHDMRDGAAAAAVKSIATRLANRVEKGRMSGVEADAAVARIRVADTLRDLADAGVLIEAIVERLDAKQALFAELETLLSPHCLFGSNTSSLSITAIARDLQHAQRLVGLHFFNPVPAMKLVEVIAGLASEDAAVERAAALVNAWGKTAVRARNTPGFVVNRIARPFYAEALLLMEQRYATAAQIDAAMRGAGFRMGPCELIDLIGQDVNLAVTESVFAANFGDRRFLPSRLQRELVEGGRLGRKTGQGFHCYPAETDAVPSAGEMDALPEQLDCVLHGTHPLADALEAALEAAPWPCERGEEAGPLRFELRVAAEPVLHMGFTDGRPAAQHAAETGRAAMALLDWPIAGLPVGNEAALPLAVSFAAQCPEAARTVGMAVLRALGVTPIELGDAPGLCVARTIAMLVNEAADAVQQDICDRESADAAMRLGTNWPAGPFDWLRWLGPDVVIALLDHLQAHSRSERYRVSPYLLQLHWCQAAAP